jgi:ATP-dependent helicase YprA (DUF1998 family)
MKKMRHQLIKTLDFKEILKKEANKFCIEAYNDYVCINGEHIFDHSDAKEIFKSLLNSMKEAYKNAKNDLEREQAKEALETLKLIPYRVH